MALESSVLVSTFLAALNHLLQAEPWARERLRPHAGESVEFRAPLVPPLRLAVDADGRLVPADPRSEPALVIGLRPGALAAAARGPDHLLRAIEVTGNAGLAGEVMFLARHLRWDAEEDLSKFVGDAAAHRLAGLAREVAGWHAEAARRIAEGLVEYAAEERRLLVKRGELDALAAAHAGLRDGLERLEKRIEKLAGR